LSGSTETSPRLTPSTRKLCCVATEEAATDVEQCSGCDPLTPDDIAEVVVFVAGRRQNVVVADTLIFPSHQVR
jgi:NADP-dependent 3-hydroxy acid dehydrogenase YdfG